ncbi:MAG TPA: isocitrate lyase/phosphoenolpyruvate mutase family protein [Pirellulales bacterium]|nr:isocitrate lyase/phosphoenolpyruvate mutase family protein [Pirellulales bacterium]
MKRSPGARLREAICGATIQVPGAPFALAARLAEREGYAAVYLSGAAFSAAQLAVPDVGLFTLDDLVAQTKRLCQATPLPVLVDADTGFGDVARCVALLEEAGAAAVQLEDQTFPKRCGHLDGKSLVTIDEMCENISLAAAARRDEDLVIIARTDARGTDSLETAIERAERYLKAGADWIFPEALETKEEFVQFADQVDAPLLANMTEFGKGPLLSLSELAEIGFAVVLYPVTMLRVAMKAMEAALGVIGDEGSQKELLDLMQTREELYDLLDYDPATFSR